MLTLLLQVNICLAFLSNTALSEEKISVNIPTGVDGKLMYNDIHLKSIEDSNDNFHASALSTQNQEVTCNETQSCKNGGSCLKHACLCLPGTSGSLCEIIDDCKRGNICKKVENTQCDYSVEEQKAYCRCNVMEYRFDDASKTCRSCLCTPTFSQKLNSFSYCEYKQGQQICTCTEGYAYNPREEICQRCDCGPNSEWCEFNDDGEMRCACKKGYAESYQSCRKCDCGKHGECTDRDSNKQCYCDPGYVEYNRMCVECRCGKYGKCVFDQNATQIGCECLPGYSEKVGKCEMCHCGENSNCSFTGNTKTCQCEEGFQVVNGFCTDVNECEKHNPCNVSTICVNTLGSYKCICDKGYKRNHETLLCDDIDECVVSIPCSQPYTKCINTPGSFKCVCETSLVARGGSDFNTFCEKTESKNIYIVSFTVFIVGLIMATAVILHQKTYLQRRNNAIA